MDAAEKRAKFGEGPWVDEPDEGMWEAHGYRCMFVRNSEIGTLCGYVGVPKEHPWYGLHYDAVQEEWNVDVHGGLTYADEKKRHSPDELWYVGFDCAHLNDLMPFRLGERLRDLMKGADGTYKDLAYVKAETERLAEQAAAAIAPPANTPDTRPQS